MISSFCEVVAVAAAEVDVDDDVDGVAVIVIAGTVDGMMGVDMVGV